MSSHTPLTATPEGVVARFGSGQQVRRLEDPALVTGQGRYTDDLRRPEAGLLHLVFVRSAYAHARINAIDTAEAAAAPGVIAVYTGADLLAAGVRPMQPAVPFKRLDGTPASLPARPVLAQGVVRFVGEPVVAVVADSRVAAERAADLVFVDAKELPAVADPVAALAPDAPRDDLGDYVMAASRHGDAARTAAAFAAAAEVVELEIHNQRLAPSAMEPRVVLAELDAADGDRLVVHLSCQMPTAVRDGIASLIPGQSAASVRVRVHDVGGGFGMKTGLYAEDVVVAWAALQLRRPVKWRGTRIEEFTASIHGRDQRHRAALALAADGRVLGLRVQTFANVGAYPGAPGVAIPLLIGPWVTTSVYDIPTIDFDLRAVRTHTTPVGAYRGAGRPEAIFLIERLMDEGARRLGLAPDEIRRRNHVRPQQMPYRNPMGQTYDVGEFGRMMEQGLALADWAGYAARQAQSRARGLLRGRAVVSFLEWTGGNALTELVKVAVLPEGRIELTSATQAMGQGIATSYAQLAVDVFGVPIEQIVVKQGDTDAANGFGSAGSRSLFTGGSAVFIASSNTVEKARELAAEALEAPLADVEYRAGRFNVVGTDLAIGLYDLAGRQPAGLLAVDGSATAQAPSWPNACHVCEVEVDPATGQVELVAYASMNDIGRIVSPQIVQGQIEGGAMQGIGQALTEQMVYSPEGQPLTASFMDYAMPRADQFLGFQTRFDTSVPCKTNTLGVKGVGELGTIGATAALVNAVIDALVQAGVPSAAAAQLQMPLTPARVWRALRGEPAAAADGTDPAPLLPPGLRPAWADQA